jgi:hypothetical protein
MKVKDDTEWSWDKNDDAAVRKLKQALVSSPVLAFFNTKAHKTYLSCDASDYAITAVFVYSNQMNYSIRLARRRRWPASGVQDTFSFSCSVDDSLFVRITVR